MVLKGEGALLKQPRRPQPSVQGEKLQQVAATLPLTLPTVRGTCRSWGQVRTGTLVWVCEAPGINLDEIFKALERGAREETWAA